LQVGLRFDTSATFLNGHLKNLLIFLSNSSVSLICNGDLLRKLTAILFRPPTLWNAFVTAHASGKLLSEAQQMYAWLLLELISWTERPPIEADGIAQVYCQQGLHQVRDR